jgi:hypothetical protein
VHKHATVSLFMGYKSDRTYHPPLNEACTQRKPLSAPAAPRCDESSDACNRLVEDREVGEDLICRVDAVISQWPVIDVSPIPPQRQQLISPNHMRRCVGVPHATNCTGRSMMWQVCE